MGIFGDIKDFVKLLVGPTPPQEEQIDPRKFHPQKTRDLSADREAALKLLNAPDTYWKTKRSNVLPAGLDPELRLLFADYELIQTKENASIFFNLEDETYQFAREMSLIPIATVEFHGAVFFDTTPHLYGSIWEMFDGDPGPRMESGYYESIWHFLLERDSRYAAMIDSTQ